MEKKMKNRLFMKVSFTLVLVAILTVGLIGTGPAFAKINHRYHHSDTTWSFGIISDTQWTQDQDNYNPNTIAAWIVKQVDQQFIDAGVDLVIAVGDTVNNGTPDNISVRALYAQDLYNAGIGFYPLRGNHEAAHGDPLNATSAADMRYAFPQIGSGVNNNTPSGITTALVDPQAVLDNNAPVDKTGETFVVGTNFSEPLRVNYMEKSLSYAFQYKNATFMLLDQFDSSNNYYNSTIPEQMYWIDKTLSQRPNHSPAFVFTHKNILGRNHKDNMFGGTITDADPGDGDGVDSDSLTDDEKADLESKIFAENEFLACMQDNDVPMVISGHDHNHSYSLVTSPDGNSQIYQLITQSDSSKFYTPDDPNSSNEIMIENDLYRVGYYIVNVDNKKVTIDYYADTTLEAPTKDDFNYGLGGTGFKFEKISTISYEMP